MWISVVQILLMRHVAQVFFAAIQSIAVDVIYLISLAFSKDVSVQISGGSVLAARRIAELANWQRVVFPAADRHKVIRVNEREQSARQRNLPRSLLAHYAGSAIAVGASSSRITINSACALAVRCSMSASNCNFFLYSAGSMIRTAIFFSGGVCLWVFFIFTSFNRFIGVIIPLNHLMS